MEASRRQTALITGASAGIGAEFAKELAKDRFDLILTARRKERLENLKRELQSKHSIQVWVYPHDLADPSTPKRLMDEIHAANIHVNFLVNNAGYGIPKPFMQVGWTEHQAFLQTMLNAVCEMTHLALPSMVKSGYGRIINVSSVAGYLPGSHGNTLYSATKSFLIKFSESLSAELQGTGIQVSVLCPGYTYSEFHDVTQTKQRVRKLPSFLWMEASTVAREGIDAVNRGQLICINGGVNQFIVGAVRLAPQRLALAARNKLSRKLNNSER